MITQCFKNSFRKQIYADYIQLIELNHRYRAAKVRAESILSVSHTSPPMEEIQVIGTAIIRKPAPDEVMDAWLQQNTITPEEKSYHQELSTQAKKECEKKIREICVKISNFYNEYLGLFAEAYHNSRYTALKPRHYVSFYTAVTISQDLTRFSEVGLHNSHIGNQKEVCDPDQKS